MTIAIIVTDDAIPAIIEEATPAALCAALSEMKIVPGTIKTEHDYKLWLGGLPAPSGWYESRDAAVAAAKRAADPTQQDTPNGEWVRTARGYLGLSRAKLARALGFNGNDNTVNKTMYEIEEGKITLNPDKKRRLVGLLALHGLTGEG